MAWNYQPIDEGGTFAWVNEQNEVSYTDPTQTSAASAPLDPLAQQIADAGFDNSARGAASAQQTADLIRSRVGDNYRFSPTEMANLKAASTNIRQVTGFSDSNTPASMFDIISQYTPSLTQAFQDYKSTPTGAAAMQDAANRGAYQEESGDLWSGIAEPFQMAGNLVGDLGSGLGESVVDMWKQPEFQIFKAVATLGMGGGLDSFLGNTGLDGADLAAWQAADQGMSLDGTTGWDIADSVSNSVDSFGDTSTVPQYTDVTNTAQFTPQPTVDWQEPVTAPAEVPVAPPTEQYTSPGQADQDLANQQVEASQPTYDGSGSDVEKLANQNINTQPATPVDPAMDNPWTLPTDPSTWTMADILKAIQTGAGIAGVVGALGLNKDAPAASTFTPRAPYNPGPVIPAEKRIAQTLMDIPTTGNASTYDPASVWGKPPAWDTGRAKQSWLTPAPGVSGIIAGGG